MSKLAIWELAKGIEFHSPSSSEVFISFTDDDSYTVSNFISKYEEYINMTILRHESDGFVFNIEASSRKEIARICDIMSEDIDVTFLEIY